jgi:uncharacterized integral membrane protein (TIGR00698 family)
MSDAPPRPSLWSEMRSTEDWWAVWIGGLLLALIVASVVLYPVPEGKPPASALAPFLAKPGKWTSNPMQSIVGKGAITIATSQRGAMGILGVGVLLGALLGLGQAGLGRSLSRFLIAFVPVFLLALLTYLLSEQEIIKYYSLEYPLWGLAVGLLVNFTVGQPAFLKPALLTEFYIKTGLVLLGVEVLLPNLIALGIPGICVSWVVTPVVLITTYIFGQKVLKMESPALNMVISADMSVCGVSAAIATGAACRAKKEEISLAITLSLVFTAIMMVVQPAIIRMVGMHEIVAGAWLGGTIDSTGAVAAAGTLVGKAAEQTAVLVKMIQNVLIGVVAFGVATYWVSSVERDGTGRRPDPWEIWYRFPKFVFGFVGVSVLFSVMSGSSEAGLAIVKATTAISKDLRSWLFCLAFVCIGLDVDFSEVRRNLRGGKPLVLYVCGQMLNLALSLAMAWLMFGVVFRADSDKLMQKAYPPEASATSPAAVAVPASGAKP